MTEFWVSGKNKWCEYCKCWLKDSVQSWAVHERGAGHRDNVARKLREMRHQQDREKKEEAHLAAAMSKVEREAKKQYEADKRAEEEHRRKTLGEWVWNEGAGYYYNAAQRWYYDTSTSMYYGGEPVQWTDKPSIPHEARYEVMNKPAGAPPPLPPPSGPPPAAARAPAAAAAAAGPAGAGQRYAVAGGKIVNSHPMAQLGGYQLHQVQGAIGGAKGVGLSAAGRSGGGGSSAAAAALGGDAKRKRDGGKGGSGGKGGEKKELTKEEQEFMARREAARARVQQRSAASFGLA